GSVDADHATGAESISIARPLVPSQSTGGDARCPDRAPLHQTTNLHAIRQPDFPRTRSLRLRGCVGVLFRQAGAKAYATRSRAAGRTAQGPGSLFADQPS